MSGTKSGAAKARETLLARDPDFFKKVGSKGGKAPHKYPRGFAALTPEQRAEWGRKGGTLSRRTSKKNVSQD